MAQETSQNTGAARMPSLGYPRKLQGAQPWTGIRPAIDHKTGS